MAEWLSYPIVQGVINGFCGAVVIDFLVFKKFQKWGDFQSYDWSVASFRWFQGILAGAISGAGIQFGLSMLQ